jgi:hypothetical protein
MRWDLPDRAIRVINIYPSGADTNSPIAGGTKPIRSKSQLVSLRFLVLPLGRRG